MILTGLLWRGSGAPAGYPIRRGDAGGLDPGRLYAGHCLSARFPETAGD